MMTTGFDDDWLDEEEVAPAAAPEAPRMHGDIPITGYNRGEPIPDLRRLPRERWREVLKPLSPYNRRRSTATVVTLADAREALALLGALEDPPPRSAAWTRRCTKNAAGGETKRTTSGG